jgi:uncharacterized C2H2 Zn-finger protein
MSMRRCPACGAWVRPWSTGGKKSRWARYEVGGSGRPEDRGANVGQPGEVVSSVWAVYGKNKDYTRQVTPSGQNADWRGGAPAPKAKKARKKDK